MPTLYFDLLVDSFFMADIVLTFCMGVVHQGKYMDEWRWVAKHYLKTSFLFDLCTSIPISYVELSVANVCAAVESSGAAGAEMAIDSTQVRQKSPETANRGHQPPALSTRSRRSRSLIRAVNPAPHERVNEPHREPRRGT